MKKLTNYIFAALLLLMTAGLQAQVVEVCAGDGTDSVTLSLAQYQYGNIQWQYSEDTLTWTDVQGAHDTVFRCLPERECYYRARIEYPNCPLDTTQVTHILFTPTADAGFDRVLSEGLEIYLDGNRVDETARCMWQVIEGDSANLEDPVFRCSRFTGPDTLYKLTWTVANACGVSTDTVEIRYMHTVMYDAIAIVDTTDIILSDSAELASGIYRIIFSAPAPNITDSTVLMGIFDGGFLRRVLDFEYYGDTCEMVTSQAGMADILLEGAINLEIPLNSGSALNRRGRDFSYTRASIVNDPRYSSGQWGDLMTDIMMVGYSSSLTRNRSAFGYFSSGPLDLSAGAERIRFEDHKIYFSDGTLADVIKHDFWKDPNDRSYHAYVTLISDLHVDFTLITPDDPLTVALDVAIPTPAGFEKEGVISIGLTVPIVLSATFSGYTRIPVRMTKPIRLGAFYKGNLNPFTIVEDWRLVDNSEKLIVEKDDDIYVSDFELQLSIGGRLSFQVWKLPGFKWSILPTLAYSRCTNTTTGFQREKVRSFVKIETNLSLKPYLGVDAGLGIEDDVIDEMIWYSPTRISANTNRNLVQPSANSYIQDPIYVHVYNQDERPVRSGRKVLFEATGGVVSATPSGNGSASAFATTNASGVAQIYWKPLSSNASLKASVLDCEGYHVKGSPLYFYSNGVADLCLNSTLSLAIGNNGRFITSGGTSPFLYSSDGVSWLPEINMSYPLAAGTYFVKDANGCIASTTYTVQEATPACNLTTSTYQNGLQVRLVANNGTAPYHFYVDGLDFTTSGTTQRVFQHTFAQDGEYTLTVTDANGCTQSSVVRLISNITPPTVVTLLRQNNPGGVYDLVFGAVTDNGGSAITNRGVEWSLSSDLSNATAVANNFTGDGLGRFSCQVTGVTSGTTFYVRAYAINSDGYIGYGRIITLTMPGSTPGPGSTTSCGVSSVRANETGGNGTITAVRDHQNNSYAVVQIGNQCWLKENMRCTTSPSTGANMVENPAVETNMSSTERRAYYYDNNPANAANGYGLLYNWPAAMDGSTAEGARGICPEGWHVPTPLEWNTLFIAAVAEHQPGVAPTPAFGSSDGDFEGANTDISQMLLDFSDNSLQFFYSSLGVSTYAEMIQYVEQMYQQGQATQEEYNSIMQYFNSTRRNATGFTAVPAGLYGGGFEGRGQAADYWSSSPYDSGVAWGRAWGYSVAGVIRVDASKEDAVAVRCLRNDGGTSAAILPTVTTSAVENVTATSATCGGNVSSDGGAAVTARGVCWSTNQNPTISDNHTTDGSGVGSFTSNISGLTAGNTYYVRAYATNSVGTAYGNEVSVTVPGSTPAPGNNTSCSVSSVHANETGFNGTITAVRDHENNSYSVVQIGGQCWLKENMRCTTSPTTGASIVENPAASSNGSYYERRAYYINNNPDSADNGCGLLYNWRAAMDGSTFEGDQGICPEGWHVPRHDDWTQLTDYVSSVVACRCDDDDVNIAKALASSSGWNISTNECAIGNNQSTNDISGFSALPVGVWGSNFAYSGNDARFWSSSPIEYNQDNSRAVTFDLSYDRSYCFHSDWPKFWGLSVRCVRDSSNGDEPSPSSTTSCNVNTIYNNETGNNGTITAVQDHENNSYAVVQIGNQCWLKENMRCTTSPSTGANMVQNPASGPSYTERRAYYYNNDPANAANGYGLLYNWPAAMDGSTVEGSRGICPDGWHVPTDADWTALMNVALSIHQANVAPLPGFGSVYSINGYATEYEGSNTLVAQMLSDSSSESISSLISTVETAYQAGYISTIDYNDYVSRLTSPLRDATGFSAVPAGYYSSGFSGRGSSIAFSSAFSQSFGYATSGDIVQCYRLWSYMTGGTVRVLDDVSIGTPVRCVRDNSVTIPLISDCTLTNVAEYSAVYGGNVVSDGGAAVTARGVCWSTFPNPSLADNHTESGGGLGSFSCTMTGLSAGTTYYARAYATNSAGTYYSPQQVTFTTQGFVCGVSNVKDCEGNVYHTIQMGTQCWMKENLRTTHYGIGLALSSGYVNGHDLGNTKPYYYNHSSSGIDLSERGLLYNWNAVSGLVKVGAISTNLPMGICPMGWHVPTDAEWTQLTNYVKGQSQYVCGSNNGIAKALASTNGWNNETGDCVPGNQSVIVNNATNFSIVPSGCYFNGSLDAAGNIAHLWSSTKMDNSNIWIRSIYVDDSAVTRQPYGNSWGLSVRCLRD